jgi:hypothetical protein
MDRTIVASDGSNFVRLELDGAAMLFNWLIRSANSVTQDWLERHLIAGEGIERKMELATRMTLEGLSYAFIVDMLDEIAARCS